MSQLAIAVDIGGTNTRAALIDHEGTTLARVSIPTRPLEGAASGFRRIAAAIRQVVGATPLSAITGIGIGAPGMIDAARGLLHFAPNLPGWIDVPLTGEMARLFGLPAVAGNDANLAALGEYRFGAGRGSRHMIYMTISTGIGGGVISDGRLFVGARGFAGEIGHCTIDINGPRCGCGNIGCLEALAAGPAIARAARAALAGGAPSTLLRLAQGQPEAISGETIAEAAALGDALALRLIDQAGVYIGIGLVNLIHCFDTELFVLGGGVTNLGEPLFDAIRRTVNERAIPIMRRDARIVRAALGDDVGLLGAAALVFAALSSSPSQAQRSGMQSG